MIRWWCLFEGGVLKPTPLMSPECSSIVLATHAILVVHKSGHFYVVSVQRHALLL